MTKQDSLLTPNRISEIYGIPRSKVYSWVRHRRFTFIKPGRRELLIRQSDFDKFLNRHTVRGYDES